MSEGAAQRFVEKKGEWIRRQLERFAKLKEGGARFLTKRERDAEYRQYKDAALKLATERLEHFNKHYGFEYGKVTIRNQRSRWGSCSKKGNLNFNYRIALLPPELADYLVVHELCHLGQFNHSKAFWSLVGQTVPDFAIHRTNLKKQALI